MLLRDFVHFSSVELPLVIDCMWISVMVFEMENVNGGVDIFILNCSQ